MKRRPLPYGFHYNIPTAFDPSVSYDMQYQRLREIVYSIIDNMEIHIPYMIFTTEAHTNDVVTLTGSFYTDHKEVLANKTFSLKGLPDGTYYININAKYKFEPCEPNCSCVKAISPDSDMTLETVYMPEGGITLYTVTRKNGEITAVDYNDIYTGMHNVDPEAHENRFSDVYAKIKAEVDRATAAETTLQHNIDNETARAMDAENVLDEKIKTEQNRATAAEHTLQDNINKEQARAEQAEATLQANITAEKNRATTAEDGLQKAIDAERTRAVAAENNLQKNIDNEVTNRTAADTAERERAVNAENELAGDIASESADRQRADTALETKLTGLIHAEETRATQAENGLKDDISTEETARINADSKEINDRTAADTALGKRIDAEIANRTSAIANEANARATADTAERERAVAAEENLQTQVTQLQEAGPGFKQDIFSDVEGLNDGDVIKLSNFKYWDKAAKDFVEKSGAKLYLANLILETLQFGTPNDTSYLKLVSSTVPGGFSAIKIMTQEGQPLLLISEEEISMIGNLTMGPVKFTANNIEDSSVLRLEGATEDKVILRGIKDGASDDSAINKKQLDTKQDKITLGDTIAMDQVSVNSVIVRGEDGAGFISRDNGTIKVSDGDSTTPIEITNIKDGTSDNSAVNKKQLDSKQDKITASSSITLAAATVETLNVRGLKGYSSISSDGTNIKFSIGGTNKAELTNIKDGTADDSAASVAQLNVVNDLAHTANQAAGIAQSDLSLLKPRVDALEANYTSQTITLQAANVEIQSGGNTVDGVNISAKRINGNVYSIMGYFTFNATGSVGSFKIKVPNKKIKEVYHEITCNSAPVDDDFTTLLNAYTLSADGGISCDFGAKRQTTVNIAVTAIVKFE